MSAVAMSVIVPAYNAENTIKRVLASVPDRVGWEVIVVDDGSSDQTPFICRSWVYEFTQLRVLVAEHQGPGAARQFGLEQAEGEYVLFADADDEFVTQAIFDLSECTIKGPWDVVIGAFSTKPRPRSREAQSMGHAQCALVRAPSWRVLTERAAIWGKVYRKDFLISNGVRFPSVLFADDVIFSWQVAISTPKCAISRSIVYWYWIDEHGQLTRNPKYFMGGLESLTLLLVMSQGQAFKAKSLAVFAYLTGVVFITRKTQVRAWPQLFAQLKRSLAHLCKSP